MVQYEIRYLKIFYTIHLHSINADVHPAEVIEIFDF